MTDEHPGAGRQHADAAPNRHPDTPDVPLETRRLRRLRRTAGIGVLAALALALAAGAAGAQGRTGAAIFLLLSATTCAVAATYGVLTAVLDDLRDHGVSRRRVAWVVGLFVGGAVLMAMTAGIGG